MDHDEPKQLKLTPKDPPKEKDSKGNKWIILAILVVSVIVSLVFYFSGKRPEKANSNQEPLGGQKVYQF